LEQAYFNLIIDRSVIPSAIVQEVRVAQPKICFGLTLLKSFLCLLCVISLSFPGPLNAQDKGPVFWTHGGNWGEWSKISAYPGLAVRTACGDDSTLKNYPVSSTDWQLQNNYTEPMAVVWRVQFFNDTSGKNEMSGWMSEHLQAGEVLDGWNVEGGHCQARNVISVQVKCAVPEGKGDDAKCYDPDGNPYPTPGGAYSRDHNPNLQNTSETIDTAPIKTGQVAAYWICQNRVQDFQYYVLTDVFTGTYSLTDGVSNSATLQDFTQQFEKWVKRRYPKAEAAGAISAQCTFMGTTQTQADQLKQRNLDQMRDFFKKDISVVVWSPK
jgi:hypothetical protein